MVTDMNLIQFTKSASAGVLKTTQLFGEELQFKNAVILVQSDAQKIEIFSIHSFPNVLKELISTLKRMIKTFEPQDISIVGLFPSLF